jgi:structural maintenance of chromosome 4
LFDLIKFKEDRYRSVFYNLLRDTLVVENIEIAKEVGIGLRKRVVTIDGKLVE